MRLSHYKKIIFLIICIFIIFNNGNSEGKRKIVRVLNSIDSATKLEIVTSPKEGSVLDVGDYIRIKVIYDINKYDKNRDYSLWLGVKPDKFWGMSFDQSKYKHYRLNKKSGVLNFKIKLTESPFRLYGRRWKMNSKGEYHVMARLQYQPAPGEDVTFARTMKLFKRKKGWSEKNESTWIKRSTRSRTRDRAKPLSKLDQEFVDALYAKDIKKAEEFLKKGADVNVWIRGQSALNRMVWARKKDPIRLLIKYNVDMRPKRNQKLTPLMVYTVLEDKKKIRELVKNGADIDAQEFRSATALRIASKANCVEIIKLLLELGADVNRDPEAIIWAAGYGHKETVKLLIKHNADVNAKARWGETALSRAKKKNHLEVVKILKAAGAKDD